MIIIFPPTSIPSKWFLPLSCHKIRYALPRFPRSVTWHTHPILLDLINLQIYGLGYMSFDSLTRGIKGALAETIYTQVIPEECVLTAGNEN
jgi:hypothetical protein